MKREKRPPTDDEILYIASAATLGIVRRWSCGCAEVDDQGVERDPGSSGQFTRARK